MVEFHSGQQPDNLAASVVDYCTGVLSWIRNPLEWEPIIQDHTNRLSSCDKLQLSFLPALREIVLLETHGSIKLLPIKPV